MTADWTNYPTGGSSVTSDVIDSSSSGGVRRPPAAYGEPLLVVEDLRVQFTRGGR